MTGKGRPSAARQRELEARVRSLERIVIDTLWMARRYAHMRQSYSVSMYNDSVRQAKALGLDLRMPDGSLFAIDASGMPSMAGISQAEFDEAVPALNAKGITPCRFATSRGEG